MKFNPFSRRFKDGKGASLVEYGLLAGLVSVVAISAVAGTGTEVKSVFSNATAGVGAGMSVAAGGGAEAAAPGVENGVTFDMTIGSKPDSFGTAFGFYGTAYGSSANVVNNLGGTAELGGVYYKTDLSDTLLVINGIPQAEATTAATLTCDGFATVNPYTISYTASVSRATYRFHNDPGQLNNNVGVTRSCTFVK